MRSSLAMSQHALPTARRRRVQMTRPRRPAADNASCRFVASTKRVPVQFARTACDGQLRCPEVRSELVTLSLSEGTLSVHPISGMVRYPSYSPDGERVAYWRTRSVARLASGRQVGTVSLHEYTFSSGEESPLQQFETGQKYVFFSGGWSGPRYYDQGERLVFCGYVSDISTEPATNTWGSCFTQDRSSTTPRLLDRRHHSLRTPGTGSWLVFGHDPERGFLASLTSGLAFVDYADRSVPRVLRQITREPLPFVSADFSTRDELVVGVLGQWGGPYIYPSKEYVAYHADDNYLRRHPRGGKGDPVPNLRLVWLGSGEQRQLKWPNPALPPVEVPRKPQVPNIVVPASP